MVMKRCLISLLAALTLSLGVCLSSFLLIHHVAEEIEALRAQSLRLAEMGETDAAQERLVQLAEMWARHEPLLEAVSPHETLRAVTELIVEADAELDAADAGGFAHAMRLLGVAVEHLYREERLRLENIF